MGNIKRIQSISPVKCCTASRQYFMCFHSKEYGSLGQWPSTSHTRYVCRSFAVSTWLKPREIIPACGFSYSLFHSDETVEVIAAVEMSIMYAKRIF